jgi:hypothetical protein
MRWLRFIDDCGRFIDDGWAAFAERLGWGPLDLFGCDRTKPCARIDRAGLLWLLNGRRLLALAADTAAIATASGGYILPSGGAFVSRAACWCGSCRSMPHESPSAVWRASNAAQSEQT